MTEVSIPIDLLNPGQVFASLGLLEFANELLDGATATFDWRDRNRARFWLKTEGAEDPIATAIWFLANAEVHSVAPAGSHNETSKWNIATESLDKHAAFPFRDPASPATLPVVLEGPLAVGASKRRIVLDHWGDSTRRDTVKFWAGAGGYPAAARANDALELIRKHGKDSADPFNIAAEQSSSFSFDWRRDYVPLEIGFSLNRHNSRIATLGYPFVELLAALGLTHARPSRSAKNALEYRYSVIGSSGDLGDFYSPNLIRAALGGSELPFEQRSFRMKLGWPGKEGQARAILSVTEEGLS